MQHELPFISAVICTHNRAKYLPSSIESLIQQTLPKHQFEVIIIDNSSTDNTFEIANRYESKFVNFQLKKEEKLGLSHARNKSIDISKSEIIAYLDDDAIAKPNWLENILKAFQENEKIAVAGGKINPLWEKPRPKWLADALLPALTIINWSEKPFMLESREQYLAGANIAFKKESLVQHGKFDPKLGRIGSRLLSGEEILLIDRMKSAGLLAYYDPNIEVDHIVPANRLNKKWFKNRFYWEGFSEARINLNYKENTKSALFYLRSKVLLKKIVLFPLIRHSAGRFSQILEIQYQLGYLSALINTN